MVKMAADEIEKMLKALPAGDLDQMRISLQDLIAQLVAKQSELDNLEKTLRESGEEDIEDTLKEIQIIRMKIIYLIDQSRIGLDRVVTAQGTLNKQGAEVQKFTVLFTELEKWMENARKLLREEVKPSNEQEIVFLIQALENLLKELGIRFQDLVPVSARLDEFDRNPELAPISSSLRPRLESLRSNFSQLEHLLKDRISSLQEIHVVFINRDRAPEGEPVVKPLATTTPDQESTPTPIFVPKPRKGDSLSKPDGSLTNVCRVEEAITTFLPQSTASTFKPIPMSEYRKPKKRKSPVGTTDSEHSAEHVSQKVYDFLGIDQPERDDAIDSRASPIPTEEAVNLRDSPRYEYYEEIKFKKPMHFGQTRHIEKNDLYETADLPEAEPEYREYLKEKKMLVEETEQPDTMRRQRYRMVGSEPKLVKEYRYVGVPSEMEEKPVESVVRTVRGKIIRKVIINGVETVTEEEVEEPLDEKVLKLEHSEEPGKRELVVTLKKSILSPSEATDELMEKVKKSVLRPEAKEFTPMAFNIVGETAQCLSEALKKEATSTDAGSNDSGKEESGIEDIQLQRKKKKKKRRKNKNEAEDSEKMDDDLANSDEEKPAESNVEPEKQSFSQERIIGKKGKPKKTDKDKTSIAEVLERDEGKPDEAMDSKFEDIVRDKLDRLKEREEAGKQKQVKKPGTDAFVTEVMELLKHERGEDVLTPEKDKSEPIDQMRKIDKKPTDARNKQSEQDKKVKEFSVELKPEKPTKTPKISTEDKKQPEQKDLRKKEGEIEKLGVEEAFPDKLLGKGFVETRKTEAKEKPVNEKSLELGKPKDEKPNVETAKGKILPQAQVEELIDNVSKRGKRGKETQEREANLVEKVYEINKFIEGEKPRDVRLEREVFTMNLPEEGKSVDYLKISKDKKKVQGEKDAQSEEKLTLRERFIEKKEPNKDAQDKETEKLDRLKEEPRKKGMFLEREPTEEIIKDKIPIETKCKKPDEPIMELKDSKSTEPEKPEGEPKKDEKFLEKEPTKKVKGEILLKPEKTKEPEKPKDEPKRKGKSQEREQPNIEAKEKVLVEPEKLKEDFIKKGKPQEKEKSIREVMTSKVEELEKPSKELKDTELAEPEKPKDEPKQKGKFPEKEQSNQVVKGEKPTETEKAKKLEKPIMELNDAKLTEPDKPKDEPKKKGKSQEREEPSKEPKDKKPVETGKLREKSKKEKSQDGERQVSSKLTGTTYETIQLLASEKSGPVTEYQEVKTKPKEAHSEKNKDIKFVSSKVVEKPGKLSEDLKDDKRPDQDRSVHATETRKLLQEERKADREMGTPKADSGTGSADRKVFLEITKSGEPEKSIRDEDNKPSKGWTTVTEKTIDDFPERKFGTRQEERLKPERLKNEHFFETTKTLEKTPSVPTKALTERDKPLDKTLTETVTFLKFEKPATDDLKLEKTLPLQPEREKDKFSEFEKPIKDPKDKMIAETVEPKKPEKHKDEYVKKEKSLEKEQPEKKPLAADKVGDELKKKGKTAEREQPDKKPEAADKIKDERKKEKSLEKELLDKKPEAAERIKDEPKKKEKSLEKEQPDKKPVAADILGDEPQKKGKSLEKEQPDKKPVAADRIKDEPKKKEKSLEKEQPDKKPEAAERIKDEPKKKGKSLEKEQPDKKPEAADILGDEPKKKEKSLEKEQPDKKPEAADRIKDEPKKKEKSLEKEQPDKKPVAADILGDEPQKKGKSLEKEQPDKKPEAADRIKDEPKKKEKTAEKELLDKKPEAADKIKDERKKEKSLEKEQPDKKPEAAERIKDEPKKKEKSLEKEQPDKKPEAADRIKDEPKKKEKSLEKEQPDKKPVAADILGDEPQKKGKSLEKEIVDKDRPFAYKPQPGKDTFKEVVIKTEKPLDKKTLKDRKLSKTEGVVSLIKDDKRKPEFDKIIETTHLVEKEKDGKDKPKEKTAQIETAHLVEKEKDGKDKPKEKTAQIETTEFLQREQPKEEEPTGVLEKKTEMPEKDKHLIKKTTEPIDKLRSTKDPEPRNEGDKKVKKEKSPEVGKEKTIGMKKREETREGVKPAEHIVETSELLAREKAPTKEFVSEGFELTEDLIKKEKPSEKDKPIAKEVTQLDKNEPEAKKPITETILLLEKEKSEPVEKKHFEASIKEGNDQKKDEPEEKQKTISAKKPEEPGERKPEDKSKLQTPEQKRKELAEQPEDRVKAQSDKLKPEDSLGVVKTEKFESKKPQPDDEGTQKNQREEVILYKEPADRKFKEFLVGKAEKPENEDILASMVARSKKTREEEPTKHSAVFIAKEKSEEPVDDARQSEKQDDEIKKGINKPKKEEELKQKEQQTTDDSGTITGTLVSMAKSLFGFGSRKKPVQKTLEDKQLNVPVDEDAEPSEEEKKLRRKRRGKKKEADEADDEEEDTQENIEQTDAPTKPKRRKKGKGKEADEEDAPEEVDDDVETKKARRRRRMQREKMKNQKLGEKEEDDEEGGDEFEEDIEELTPELDRKVTEKITGDEEEVVPQEPKERSKSLKEEDLAEPKQEDNSVTKNASLDRGALSPASKAPETGPAILFQFDPTQKPVANQPQHGVMSAPVEPKTKLDAKKPEEPTKPSAPTYADLFTQTSSPEVSPRGKSKLQTTEEGIQTEIDETDKQNQTYRRSSKDDSRKQTTEKYQQTSKPQSPSRQTTGTSPQVFSPEESSAGTEKIQDRKPGDKSPEDSFDVHVTAKVSVTQPDVPPRTKERRKWSDKQDVQPEDVQVSSTISVRSPRDLIEAEKLNIDLRPSPQAEISINLKPTEKSVADFLQDERRFTRKELEDGDSSRKGKEKKPRRGDTFLRKESGMPSRKDSSDELSDGDVKKPEDDKYKISVDVKVKPGDTPQSFGDSGKVEIGTNIPSPRDSTDFLEPEKFTLHLEKTSDLGKNRILKLQNMKKNPRVMTFMVPTNQSASEEDIRKNVKNIESEVGDLKDAIDRKDYIVIKRIFVHLIKNMDDWLETVEYRIILNRQNSNEGPNRDKVNELKSLRDEVGRVRSNVSKLLKKVPQSDEPDVVRQLRTYVEQLEPQIAEIQDMTETEQETEAENLSKWEEFLNGVNNLSVLVEEARQHLDTVIDSDGSASSKLQDLEKIEADNCKYADRAVELLGLAKDIANEFPNQKIPPETYSTFETTKMIQNSVNSERERLLQLLSLVDEYEQTLKDFAQIVEVADNLVESPITITSLEHLQDEMQKHRKFFVNLSHCRAILESLEDNLDRETRGVHNQLHGKLHAKASSILDKAASRAQQMAMAASRWTVLDKGARNEQQWLQVAHQRLPDLQQVMSSDHDRYISLYQSLASDAAIHHAKILQLVDVANKLQDIITCVGLEDFHEDYLNVILKLQEEIQSNLEKVVAFQAMWTLYEVMSKKLSSWVTTAEKDLKNLKSVPGRANMRQFWELKAQFEVHNRLRQEMGNNFEKAVQFLPIADEMTQRQILGNLEDRWKKLESEIKKIQDSAMASLSAQDVPVNEKLKLLEDELNELNDTVDNLRGVIKTDEELNLYIERLQVLNNRLDTIQEELGRLGLLPAAESEKVGHLLGMGRRLEQQLLGELHESILLREKLLALQKGLDRVKRNQNSISSVLDQCGVAQTMDSNMIQQAVTTCENITADLTEQWQELMDLRQVLHTLPMRLRLTVSPIKVEREISQLQEVHTVLEERCKNLRHLLGNRLSMWRRFEKQLEEVQRNVQETDYMVELLTVQGSVDLDRLQTATNRLKDLHDSVNEREELIKELKRLAEPLASTCNPEVASQLNAQVSDAVTAWNDTRKNLYQIVDKYKDAVKLWKNYRETRDDIRKWIDQQWRTLDLLQDKPEEAVEKIKEFRETLATQKARLDELKKLVAQIAADIGLDPGGLLGCEVEDLGKRLEDVKETLTTLTSVAESRTQGKDVCKDELVKSKTFLNSVQKSLSVVGENGNENTLSTLRDHLLALGKTESQVQTVKEKSIKMNEKPHEIKSETSVVEILELWQQVFRETFQQYYRLSAKLVRSQDGAAALQLWQEYLHHVQTFLAGSLPEDYDGLRETQRLCEVHQNLLTSQQSVLSSRKDDPAIRDFSQALQEQFNSLANLHNETLSRIMDRHNEVNKRLKMWDAYRLDQSKLLSWLRDMTRDQSRLQLRYIHLRRLPKLIDQIDVLLSKIPLGKSLIQEQQRQQEDIVKFCDEALATSIKMETVATAERINNLEASLKSWKDFLNRVNDLHKNYESELEKVEKVCDEVTSELAAPAPVSFSAIQSRLDLCRDLRNRISKYSKNIEEANVTYDQLKECLSPHDMKMLSQRLWLMGQRQGDLEHHLLLQILWLEDRLETQQAFNLRQARFLNWANDLIKRFEKHSSTDPTGKFLDVETRAKRLEAEVQIELSLKNREYSALHAMANNIIDLSKEDAQDRGKVMSPSQNRIDYEIMKADVERKITEINDVWEQLKNLKCLRLERKSKLLGTMNELWKRLEDIKLWLISVEERLEAPSIFENSTKKCVDRLIADHEVIQGEIEKQSGNVGEVLNLCELFLADPAVELSGIDTNEFESAMQALEKRWKSVCLSSSERKGRILAAWDLLLQLSKICKDQQKWIAEREKALQNLISQSENPKLVDVQKLLSKLENEKRELDSRAPALKILDASYSKLAQESRLPADNIQKLAGSAKALTSKWHNLYEKLKHVSDKLAKLNRLRDDFIRHQNNSIVLLTNISAKLMQAELLPNPKKRLKEVRKLEQELERESGCLRAADETSLELMKAFPEPQNVSATQKMVDEYQMIWKELRNRFTDVKNKSMDNLASKEIQVSTLAFEADSEVQVDTLPHLERLTSRDAYGLELDVALRECGQNLSGLENILKAPEGEPGVIIPTHKTLAKIIATCTSSVELVQHLNQTLIEDCGMNDVQARTDQVKEMLARFEELLTRAREREQQLREASERGRLTCPICSRRNWQQLENDLWRLEQWIQYAEAIQNNRPSLPAGIEALEDVIQSHRELLVDLDSHKSIIVSLNIVGDHLADHENDVDKARALREKLRGLNLRWDNVCSQAAHWQGKLQGALIENPEFHDTISELVKWLENTEAVIRNSEPVDLAQDRIILESQYKKFKVLSKELERCEPRVHSLQEAAVQLLDRGGSARERLNALRLRLTGMRRLIKVYLLRLGAVLGSDSIEALDQTLMSLSQEMLDGADSMSQAQSSSTAHTNGEDDTEISKIKRGFMFLGRVFKASLPIQALMLLLLGAAALVPDEYYSCAFSNKAGFQSYYPNGPPPV